MEERDLHDRLRALGEQPIDDDTRASHLSRIAAVEVTAGPRRRRFGPLAVAGAGIVGFLVGSTGLAMAGALPDSAQGVAHDVLGVVQVDVPDGKEGKRGPCIAEAAKIEDPDEKAAAKEACPKGPPVSTPAGPGGGDHTPPGQDKHADDPCTGRPPWAGQMTSEERDAAKEAGRGDCPQRDDDEPRGDDGDLRGQDKHADDPCRGKPPWAGPMSQEEREAAKEAASRDGCVDDDDTGDDDTGAESEPADG